MGKLVYIDGHNKQTIIADNLKEKPVIVKTWSGTDIKTIAKDHGYKITAKQIAEVVTAVTPQLTSRTDEDELAVLEIIEGLDVPKKNPIDNQLAKLHMKWIECRDCEHYDSEAHCCYYYCEKTSPHNTADDCNHFMPNEQMVMLVYDNGTDTSVIELPVVYTWTEKELDNVCTNKNALLLRDLFKNTALKDDIENAVYDVEDEENPDHWAIEIGN